MGDFGSTRWNDHPKARTVENCFCVSTSCPREHLLNKHAGVMRPDPISRWVIRCFDSGREVLFEVRAQEGVQPVLQMTLSAVGGRLADGSEQTIAFVSTRPHLGGIRWWFQCPSCSRRASFLYLPPRSTRFACRVCCHLTFRSSQESHPIDINASLHRFYERC